MHNNNALEIHDVTKYMEAKLILEQVDLQIAQGELCLLVGPNGAGKSVLLRCIMGLEKTDGGTIKILDRENCDRIYIRSKVGFVSSEHLEFLNPLTANEYFLFLTDLYKVPAAQAERLIKELAPKLSLEQHLDTVVQNLSFGTKKKVQLLAVLLYDPDLLICDEIFEGLDTQSIEVVQEIFVQRSKRGKTVLFTSHIEEIADRVATVKYFLNHGKITGKVG